MSKTIEGTVTKIYKKKGQVNIQGKKFDKLSVTVTDKEGNSVAIEKLVTPGNDGKALEGKKLRVTYEEREVELEDGTTFTARSAKSKDFVLLDAEGKPSEARSQAGSSGGGGYDSKGARNGMITQKGIDLAIAIAKLQSLKDVPQSLIDESVAKVKKATEHLESGRAPEVKPAAKAVSKAKAVHQEVEEDDEPPFED